MAETTGIQWCDATFNPWRGCTKVSAGCQHCYAETLSKRNPGVLGSWGPQGHRAIAAESYWKQPLCWNRAAEKAGERRRVFCASLADVFEDRPELVEPRERLFNLIDTTPVLDWLLLTKRPENIGRLTPSRVFVHASEWPDPTPGFRRNVWLGVSIENQATADERIPLLLQTPAAVRFLSVEPLLSAVDLTRFGFCGGVNPRPVTRRAGSEWEGYLIDHENGTEWHPADMSFRSMSGIHQVIIGGESGPKARPCNLAWVRALVEQCQAANVATFFKQAGSRPVVPYYCEDDELRCWALDHAKRIVCPIHGDWEPGDRWQPSPKTVIEVRLRDGKGGDPSEWPEDLRVREFPPAPRER